MFNRVILIGRVCADPDVRATADGKQVTHVRLATNVITGSADQGTRKDIAEFHNVVMFGKLAEVAGTYLRKGRLICAEGHLHHHSWQTQDGQRRTLTQVVADQMQMVGSKPAEEADAG